MVARRGKAETIDSPRVAKSKPQFSHLQLSEIVAATLRERIVTGKLKPGEFLRTYGIAKSLDVSMTPVREGLLLLQSEGFVRLIPRRGFVVNSFTKSDLLDLFWAQATLGAELSARAVRAISDDDIKRLAENVAAYERAIADGDAAAIDKLGHVFHRTINKAANSPRLALLLGSLTRQLSLRFYAEIEGHLGNALEYHGLILKTFTLRDHQTAASLMHRHLYDAGEQLVRKLDDGQVWEDGAGGAARR